MDCIKVPCNLDFLLHCSNSGEEYAWIDAPVIQKAVEMLLNHELIERNEVKSALIYSLTEKGRFYIEYLLNTPFPETVFSIPERN